MITVNESITLTLILSHRGRGESDIGFLSAHQSTSISKLTGLQALLYAHQVWSCRHSDRLRQTKFYLQEEAGSRCTKG